MTKILNVKSRLKYLALAALSALLIISVLIDTEQTYADPLGTVTRVGSISPGIASIAEGADGNMWFGAYKGYIGKSTKNGLTDYYQVDPSEGYFVNSITRGPDGNVWFTMQNNKFGKITPSGTPTIYSLPSGVSPQSIVRGPDDNIWIATYAGTSSDNYIRVYNTSGTSLHNYPTSGYVQNMVSNPADSSIWYTQNDTLDSSPSDTVSKISLDGVINEYSVPLVEGIPSGISLGSDGKIWFAITSTTDQTSVIGKLDSTGSITTYPISYRVSSLIAGLDGNIWFTSRTAIKVTKITTAGIVTDYSTNTTYNSRPAAIATGSDGNVWFTEPSELAKIGTGINGSTSDNDGDGLPAEQEFNQGTSDFSIDTDQDGLSDSVESAGYSGRDALFCNSTVATCEYPSPTRRDLYVETDWMVKPGTGGYSMQPDAAQINSLKTAYANKGILAHFDTGQLGGGNAVPYNQTIDFTSQNGSPDFYDYKLGGDGIAAQFNSNRLNVYHYMLFGYNYSNVPASSGISYPGDDDVFISYGLVKDTFGSANPLDTEIAGTALHELGHNLCLTGINGGTPMYAGQPASCRYFGVDTNYGSTYPSVMNYDYQLSSVDYSSGVGLATSDHNDWSTIRLQDFTTNHSGDPTLGANRTRPNKLSAIKAKFIPGPTAKDIANARIH